MKRLVVVLAILAGCNNSPPATTAEGRGELAPRPDKDVAAAPVASSAAAAPSSAPTPSAKIVVLPAAQDADALSLIRTERLKAKADGRVLVVYVGATWCEPCQKLKHEIHSGRLDDKLGKTTLLAFDADRDTERLKAAGYTFGYIPYVALPGADGHPSDSKEASGKGSDAWRELLEKLEAWQR